MSVSKDVPLTKLSCVYKPDGSRRPKLETMVYLVGVVHHVKEESRFPCEAKGVQLRVTDNEVSIVPFGNLGTMLGHPRTSAPKEIIPPDRNEECLRFHELDATRLSTTTKKSIDDPRSLSYKSKINVIKKYMWSFSIVDYGKLDLGAASMAMSRLSGNEYFKRTKNGLSLSHTISDLPGSPFLAPGEPPLLRNAFNKYEEYAQVL